MFYLSLVEPCCVRRVLVEFGWPSVLPRVPPTNSEMTSHLLYPVDPYGLRIERDQVSSWARPGFLWNLSSDRGSLWLRVEEVI